MDIRYAILGLLGWRPFTGYDLKKIISESELFYWSGNNNQIYYSLVELHKQALVTQEIQPQESLPARKVYTITAAGREQLRRWAGAAPELTERRQNFLIQLAWTEGLPGRDLLALLDAYEQEIRIQQRMVEVRFRAPAIDPKRSEREGYLWKKINEKLLSDDENELKWVQQVRKEIQEQFAD